MAEMMKEVVVVEPIANGSTSAASSHLTESEILYTSFAGAVKYCLQPPSVPGISLLLPSIIG